MHDVLVSNESNKAKKNGNNRNGQNRIRHELDAQGLVPLPAATCFYCCKSCKKAPLIACDYCPLFFHQVNCDCENESTESTWFYFLSRRSAHTKIVCALRYVCQTVNVKIKHAVSKYVLMYIIRFDSIL